MISIPHELVGLHNFVSDSNLSDEHDISGLYMKSEKLGTPGAIS